MLMRSRRVASQMQMHTIIGEQALPAPPTDELSEVKLAYQSGEQIDDRPASALSGVQPALSFEGVGVGADNNVDACAVRVRRSYDPCHACVSPSARAHHQLRPQVHARVIAQREC